MFAPLSLMCVRPTKRYSSAASRRSDRFVELGRAGDVGADQVRAAAGAVVTGRGVRGLPRARGLDPVRGALAQHAEDWCSDAEELVVGVKRSGRNVAGDEVDVGAVDIQRLPVVRRLLVFTVVLLQLAPAVGVVAVIAVAVGHRPFRDRLAVVVVRVALADLDVVEQRAARLLVGEVDEVQQAAALEVRDDRALHAARESTARRADPERARRRVDHRRLGLVGVARARAVGR
jgi:hypothetical protein